MALPNADQHGLEVLKRAGVEIDPGNKSELMIRVYVMNPSAGGSSDAKAGNVDPGDFAGNPKKYTVVFGTPFSTALYAIHITGADPRVWSWESKTAAGFVINSNADTALTGLTSWQAIPEGS